MRFLSTLALLFTFTALPAWAFAPADTIDADEALTTPLPEANGQIVEAGVLRYDASVQTQGQEMSLDVRRTIEETSVEGEAAWRIVEAMVMPMGSAVDTFEVDRASLHPLRRSAGGGGTSISLQYTENAVTGSMSGPGRPVDINTGLQSAIFADGSGLELAIAALPLEEGYSTILRTFDPESQQIRAMQLHVKDREEIQVEAGSFETLVVDLEPLDGSQAGQSTLHLMVDQPHYLVKGEYRLPAQMGSGTMTIELTARE